MGGGPNYLGYQYMASLIGFVLPEAERLGLATAEEVGVETLQERIREEVVALGGVVGIPSFTGAWVTKPADNRRT